MRTNDVILEINNKLKLTFLTNPYEISLKYVMNFEYACSKIVFNMQSIGISFWCDLL